MPYFQSCSDLSFITIYLRFQLNSEIFFSDSLLFRNEKSIRESKEQKRGLAFKSLEILVFNVGMNLKITPMSNRNNKLNNF